jgi:hypothetical protein
MSPQADWRGRKNVSGGLCRVSLFGLDPLAIGGRQTDPLPYDPLSIIFLIDNHGWRGLRRAEQSGPMMRIAFVLAAAAVVLLITAPPAAPAKAQDLKMAQGVDVQIGRDRYDRYDRDRRSDTTVGIGPGGVTIGPRQRCRMDRVFL